MSHLLANLLAHGDPWMLGPIVAVALIAGALTTMAITGAASLAARAIFRLAAFTAVMAVSASVIFRIAVTHFFPQIPLAAVLRFPLEPALFIVGASLAAGAVHLYAAASVRNAMLSGSLLASGVTAFLVATLAELVAPYRLAYDLSGVLCVVVLGAALFTFALWEQRRSERMRAWAAGTLLFAGALAVIGLGAVASILPFGGWLNAVDRNDNLLFSPLAILLGAEAVVCLLLTMLGSLVDHRVAARNQLEAARLHQLADSAFEGLLIHRNGQVIDGNRSMAQLLGLPLVGLPGAEVARYLSLEEIALEVGEAADRTPRESVLHTARGEQLPVELLSRRIFYRGEPVIVSAIRDISERHSAEARIRFLAHHDMLTELPNRVLLRETLTTALRSAEVKGHSLAVFCLDLDGFKLVNDSLGHAAGDALLQQVADRLRHALSADDFVARIGGDEFVVLQRSEGSTQAHIEMAEHLIAQFEPRFELDNERVDVGTSVGISIYPVHGSNAATLLERADIALYEAKQNGRRCHALFRPGMNAAATERRLLQAELELAPSRDELYLVYQPLFDADGHVQSYEALMRWRNARRGDVPPSIFIPIAEQNGFIVKLGEWALRTACGAAVGWPSSIRIAVNLSPVQVTDGDLAASIPRILAESRLAANRLEIEITEGVLLKDPEQALAVLGELREVGVHIVLDDFGTGYSSLSYLHRFPIDKLKIDRSFIQRIAEDGNSRAIVNAIISMSRDLKLRVTAEGVETEQQREILCAQGCDELQGVLLGPPIPASVVPVFGAAQHARASATG